MLKKRKSNQWSNLVVTGHGMLFIISDSNCHGSVQFPASNENTVAESGVCTKSWSNSQY
jgi:hypothetical protein